MPPEVIEEENTEEAVEEVTTADLFAEFSGTEVDEVSEDDSEEGEGDSEGDDSDGDGEAEEDTDDTEVVAEEAQDEVDSDEDIAKALAAKQREIDALTHKIKSDDGRVSALQRKINALEKAQQPDAISPTEFAKAFKSKDSWKAFAEDNPEAAKPIEEFMQGLAEATAQNLEKTDKKATQAMEANAVDEDAKAQDALTQAHPEWLDWIVSDDYMSWISQQPASLQTIVEDGTVEDSIKLLDMFKTYMIANGKFGAKPPVDPKVAKIKQKRNRQLQDGQQTPANGGSAKPISDSDTSSLFDHFVQKRTG